MSMSQPRPLEEIAGEVDDLRPQDCTPKQVRLAAFLKLWSMRDSTSAYAWQEDLCEDNWVYDEVLLALWPREIKLSEPFKAKVLRKRAEALADEAAEAVTKRKAAAIKTQEPMKRFKT